jgi:hypothetical protein
LAKNIAFNFFAIAYTKNIFQYRKYTNVSHKIYIEYLLSMRLRKNIYAMFLANAKSTFGAIFWLFVSVIFRIFWKNSGFPYVNQLWKISYLLYEMGLSLFAFVKHLYTYGNFFFVKNLYT